MKKCIIILSSLLLIAVSNNLYAQDGSSLNNATPFCTDVGANFILLGNNGTAESGPDYDCLSSQPSPTWFYFKMDVGGALDLTMVGASGDIDFALWGPYTSLVNAKSGVSGGNAPIDCSYSFSATEVANIGSSSADHYFILLITNYINVTQNVSLTKTGGDASATTACDILTPIVSTGTATVNGISALCNGEVYDYSSDGVPSATGRGICYSTSSNPTTSNPSVSSGSGNGTFSASLTGLNPGTTYHYRAYAVNGNGTSYGADRTFETPPNTPPLAINDVYTRFYTDTGLSFTEPASGILANDTDADNDPLTVGTPRPASGVSSGSLTLNTNGSFTYTSNSGFIGSDSFTYYANDGTVNSNSPATVTINVVTPRFIGPGNNFSDPGNWNAGYVPPESLNIIIAAGQHINFDASYTCKNLTFESSTSSFSCTSPNTLTITGNVLDGNGKTAIEVNSALEVSSSIEIPQSATP